MTKTVSSKSNFYWKKKLTPDQFDVCRLGKTESPFSGKYNKFYKSGNYHCAACNKRLFSSEEKFDSGSGWPSFWDYVVDGVIVKITDNKFDMQRTEVLCANCGSHLGHVFEDGPETTTDGKPATGLRYCINSIALDFVPSK